MKKYAVFLAFLVFLSAASASAWVEPQSGENIPAPLNTSSQGQEKKGWLNINNWIKVITSPFSFDVGMESPKYCIKKPDGSTSCCPPQAGQDWSACGTGGGVVPGEAKWVWNKVDYGRRSNSVFSNIYHMDLSESITAGAYDLVTVDPSGVIAPVNTICHCNIEARLAFFKNTNLNPQINPQINPEKFFPNVMRAAYCVYTNESLAKIPTEPPPFFYYCFGKAISKNANPLTVGFVSTFNKNYLNSSLGVNFPPGDLLRKDFVYELPSCAESCAAAYFRPTSE